jgi:hypothetical protein
VANGEPDTWLNAPVDWLTENTETLVDSTLPVARSPPLGLKATGAAWLPAANGEPDTWLNAPVDWLTENTDTLVDSTLPVARSPPPGLKATHVGKLAGNGEPGT